MQIYLYVIVIITININICHCFLEGIYCGKDNCYEVLGVKRDASREHIAREYRILAAKWHPDKNKDEEATQKFRLIAQAYSILKDEESRKNYDYMLDNPEEYYAHYYRYYRKYYAPKVDVRIVILVTISVISVIQYYAYNSRYKDAIDYLVTVPKYRNKAKEIALDEGIWPTFTGPDGKLRSKQRGNNKQRLKDELKQEEENCIRKVVEEMMDIKGAYSKPSYKDLLWIQIFTFPVYIANYIYWYGRWIYKFDIKKEPYGVEEKHYLIRKYMNLSELQWLQKSDSEIESYMKEELWIKENFDPWKEKRDNELRIKLAENPSYKRYRRYLRKGGPGQISFLDD